jgi:hypothetical protein
VKDNIKLGKVPIQQPFINTRKIDNLLQMIMSSLHEIYKLSKNSAASWACKTKIAAPTSPSE